MKNILIVCNPNSGLGIPVKILQDYYKKLTEAGYNVDVSFTKRCSHATEIVENAGEYDLVFALGGDGTLNEVVNGNIKRKNKMAVCPLPAGSCNDVASMLGFNKRPLENLDLAMNGELKEMDIGVVNNKAFTYVVGMGKFMHIPYETSKDIKNKIGYLAYIKEGIKELFSKPKLFKTKISLDGNEINDEYSLIIISNSNHIAGVENFHKDVKLDDGEFEVLLFKSKSNGALISDFVEFLIGRNSKNVISTKAKNINITLKDYPKKNWCIDGEKLSENVLEYNINANNKMDFLVPKNNNKLFTKKI